MKTAPAALLAVAGAAAQGAAHGSAKPPEPASLVRTETPIAKPLTLQARVAAVRAAWAAAGGADASSDPDTWARLAAAGTNWTNWPKWSKWSNWANK